MHTTTNPHSPQWWSHPLLPGPAGRPVPLAPWLLGAPPPVASESWHHHWSLSHPMQDMYTVYSSQTIHLTASVHEIPVPTPWSSHNEA